MAGLADTASNASANTQLRYAHPNDAKIFEFRSVQGAIITALGVAVLSEFFISLGEWRLVKPQAPSFRVQRNGDAESRAWIFCAFWIPACEGVAKGLHWVKFNHVVFPLSRKRSF